MEVESVGLYVALILRLLLVFGAAGFFSLSLPCVAVPAGLFFVIVLLFWFLSCCHLNLFVS
jgi:hypothetical protein